MKPVGGSEQGPEGLVAAGSWPVLGGSPAPPPASCDQPVTPFSGLSVSTCQQRVVGVSKLKNAGHAGETESALAVGTQGLSSCAGGGARGGPPLVGGRSWL